MVTVIVVALLAIWVVLAVRSAKKHKCSCGGDCSRCCSCCAKEK
ncbi:MAG: FeoB-associated Cys-rich membrane protein [Clostridia bacterium]|nr:FeoB-associated Cys-rich membrane protein [Clostridia bacterium]